ncbi:MAG TPA: aminotransferase class I/II-fold pyridoxal phosphate-dependent enzyme, partial [Nitrososphaerales archaeon]|nr:aminotransferase class I/II-fold pyridoxal phosphate-dependent enzyme [Nitrososphaerales archaeon]
MNLVAPQGAFYVFPRVGRGTPDSNAFSRDFLSRYKVATIPGASFGNGGEGHIRISYALDEDKLAEAMLRLSKFKREFGMQNGRPKSEG